MRLWVAAIVLVCSAIALSGYFYYQIYMDRILWEGEEEQKTIFVTDADDFDSLEMKILNNCTKVSKWLFNPLAKRMNLPKNVHAGKYVIPQPISLIDLIRKFRNGLQEPVTVVIPETHSIQEALIRGTRSLQIDSLDLLPYFESSSDTNITPHFILPNSYEMYWNISLDNYLKRLQEEGQRFWTRKSNIEKLDRLGLTAEEAYILASIVSKETNHKEEMARIAGVYYNRIKIGMPLQADPTIRYILRNSPRNRVLFKDLEIESPYNTYKTKGLPPGPIGLASINSIRAVLKLEDHNYLYFCADPNEPGTHIFSKSYREHINNARRYHQYLDKYNE